MTSCWVMGASCRAIAESLVRIGVKVYAIDQFMDRDLQAIAKAHVVANLRDIPTILTESNSYPWIDDIAPQSKLLLAGGMENAPQSLRYLETRFRLLGPRADQVIELRRVEHWKRWAQMAGIGFPLSIPVKELGTLPADDFTKWIWKPKTGAGGIGIFSFDARASMTLDGTPSLNSGYLQHQIEGVTLGVTFLFDGANGYPVFASRQWSANEVAGPTPFLYRGSVGPVELSLGKIAQLQRLGSAIAADIPFRGWLGVDFILDPEDSLHCIDLNPRWTASMELYEHLDPISWCQWLLEDRVIPSKMKSMGSNRKRVCGKRIFYAQKDTSITEERSDHLWQWSLHVQEKVSTWRTLDRRCWMADLPTPGTKVPKGYPLCSILAIGDNEMAVAEEMDYASHPLESW